MKAEIVKNNTEYTSCYTHPFEERLTGACYCRAANTLLNEEQLFCTDCPLMVYDAKNQQCFGCYYYDTAPSKAESDQKRIQEAIEIRLLPEFPYYLEEQENHLVEYAMQYAAEVHKGITRKGVKVPYIAHVIEAACIVEKMTEQKETIAAAVLHDVLEDTDTTVKELENLFGEKVVELVQFQTEDKRKDQPSHETWELRKTEALEHYRHAPIEAKKIALADKLSNIRASAYDFQKMGDKMWEKFNQKNKEKQKWYYQSILQALIELKDTDAYKEYESLVTYVFF